MPYSPSFLLALADVSPSIKNLQDLLFLPGFNSPTLALLCSPTYTWAGKLRSNKDTYHLEIRTFDFSGSGSFPLLTSVTGLPSDSLYLVACPTSIGGVVVITTNGIVHVDQGGRLASASVNAWWGHSTNLHANTQSEERKLSLEGSRAEFVSDHDMLLILQNGDAHQVRFEMDGRAVGTIKVDEQSSSVPPPSTIVAAGENGLFIGSSEGDSLLARVEMIRDEVVAEPEAEEKKNEMEVDWDEGELGG